MISRSEVRTRVTVTGEEQAQAKLRRVEGALNTVAGGTRGLASAFASIGPGAAVMGAGIGAAVVTITGLSAAAEKAASALGRLGMRGGDVSAVATAFEQLASPELLANIQRSTGRLVSSFDTMRLSVQLLRAGISESDIPRWFQLVTRAAQDTGQNVQASLERMTTALVSGRISAFQRLGIDVGAVRDRVREMGLSMETAAGRSAALSSIMETLSGQLGAADNSAGNLNDAFTQLSTVWSDWYDSVARAFSEDTNLVAFFSELAVVLGEQLPDSVRTAHVLVDFSTEAIVLGSRASVEFTNFGIAVLNLSEALLGVQRFFETANPMTWVTWAQGEQTATESAIARINTMRESLTAFRNTASDVSDIISSLRARAEQRTTAEISQSAQGQSVWSTLDDELASFGPGTGPYSQISGAATNAPPSHSRRPGRRTAPEIVDMGALLDAETITTQLIEGARELWTIEQGISEATGDVATSFDTVLDSLSALGAPFERQQSAMEIQNQLLMRQLELQTSIAEREQQRIAAIERGITAFSRYSQVAVTSGNVVADIFGKLAQAHQQEAMNAKAGSRVAKEQAREAEKMGRVQGSILAGVSFVKAAMELGASISSFASQNYVAGAQHLASMASYTAAGILALRNLGGRASQGSVAVSSAGGYAKSQSSEEKNESTQSSASIQIYTMGYSQASLGRELESARWQLQRSGVDSYMTPAGNML